MTTTIYFIRHGQVVNKDNIFYGRLPRFGLSQIGIKQITSASKYLQHKKITHIYSSSLLRARQSAFIVSNEINCDIISKTNLITETHSYLEGKPFDTGAATNFDFYFSPLRSDTYESMEDIKKRMMRFVNSTIKKHPGETVVAIAHGDPFMILRASLIGLPMAIDSIRPKDGSYVKNGEIYEIISDEGRLAIRSAYVPRIE